MSFLPAVFVFGEPSRTDQLLGFCPIWAAVASFSVDSALASRRPGNAPEPVLDQGPDPC